MKQIEKYFFFLNSRWLNVILFWRFSFIQIWIKMSYFLYPVLFCLIYCYQCHFFFFFFRLLVSSSLLLRLYICWKTGDIRDVGEMVASARRPLRDTAGPLAGPSRREPVQQALKRISRPSPQLSHDLCVCIQLSCTTVAYYYFFSFTPKMHREILMSRKRKHVRGITYSPSHLATLPYVTRCLYYKILYF